MLLPIVSIDQSGVLLRPMQLFIKYSIDPQGVSTLKMYLQQVVTRFMGGKYTQTRGYIYSAANTTKAASVQRLITNFHNVHVEVEGLVKEANRFMYMYCQIDNS